MRSSLFINRLIIITLSGETAYDERFHRGVNIIRGENSSGKSTITNLIFYVLGAEFTDFVPEAKNCAEVIAETEMNGAVITIRRAIELDEEGKVKTRIPMYFYWGSYDESRNPPPEKNWQRFGYNSYPEKKSFSNVIFDNLDIPTVKGDNSNITVHQLLRLMYIDQESPTTSLYYFDQFDSHITRQTSADLLLGVYDDELYQNRRRLVELDSEISEVKSDIRVMKNFFGNPQLLVPANIQTKIDNAYVEIAKLDEQISNIRSQVDATPESTGLQQEFRYEQLINEIKAQRLFVSHTEEVIEQNRYEIKDNDFFIETLDEKLKALKNSLHTREFLHNFPIDYCPECLTEIKTPIGGHDPKTCKLCKERIDESYGVTQGRRMEQEISFQINESLTIQKTLQTRVERALPVLSKERGKLSDLQRQFDEASKNVRTSSQELLDSLLMQKGFLEGEILQQRTMLENADRYQQLLEKRDELERSFRNIQANITSAERQQERLRARAENQIKQEALYFLNKDLHRQDDFKVASDFHVDFRNNIAFLASRTAKYSASSSFYLKISARFAIFLASLSIPEMRYPRFILADNMEDKGIEKERAQNFQKILIERLSNFQPDAYQVIYTTSYITDELNKSDLVVGDFYTKDNRTLKHVKPFLS